MLVSMCEGSLGISSERAMSTIAPIVEHAIAWAQQRDTFGYDPDGLLVVDPDLDSGLSPAELALIVTNRIIKGLLKARI